MGLCEYATRAPSLSDCDAFDLPSESSEFVMYDPEKQLKDGTTYGSHNYWYSQ